MTSRSSSERSEAPGLHLLARQRHKAPGNGRLRGAVATRFRQVALGQTDRAVVLAGRHVQDHQVERPLEQQVAVAQHLPALQTHLLASMVANPWPLHFHAAAVVADLALRMAPAITPTVPMATMSGPAHGRGVLLHHLGQGLDPGQETEPIHAETDCVHRVCQRRHRKRGGKGFRATGTDRSKPGKLGPGHLLECLPDRAKLGRLNLQRRFPGLQLPHGPAQTAVVLAQRLDRRLLAPRSPQRRAQLSSLVGRQLRQRRPGRPKLGEPGLQLLLTGFGHLQGMAQPETLVGQRPGAGLGVAQYPHLPVEPKGLAGQLLRGLPDALRPLLLLVEARVQPGVLLVPPDHLLVEPAEFRAKRPDGLLLVRGRLQDGAPPGRSGPRPGRALTGLRCRQGLAQPGVLLAQRPGRIEGRRDAGFRKERLQARHFRLQGRHVPCRAAGFLRLFDGLTQPTPAGLEPRLPRTAIAAGGHFRPAQLFRARFGRVRPRPFPLTL